MRNTILNNLNISAENKGVSTGNKWLDGKGKVLESFSPVDGKLIGKVSSADEKEYKKTKPIYTTDNNIAEKLDPSIFGKDLERIQQKTNGKSNFVEPSKLMEYIRTRLNTK